MTALRGISLVGKWTPRETAELCKILKPLPPAWLEHNPHVKAIDRQAVLTDAPPDAPGHSKYDPSARSIVVYDKGVYHGSGINPEQFRRSVYHELAHTILRHFPGLLEQWRRQTRRDGFVDDYAKTGPEEDFADTFSEFFIFPKKTRQIVPQKASFMRTLLAESNGKEKVAMHLMNAFADELMKTAGKLDALKGVMSGLTGAKIGKGVALGGGGLAAGAAVGHGAGKKKGYETGVGQMDEGMRQAYKLGIQRGARAMQQAIVQQMRGQGK